MIFTRPTTARPAGRPDALWAAPDIERDAELLWRFWVRLNGGDTHIPWSAVRTKSHWRTIALRERADLGRVL